MTAELIGRARAERRAILTEVESKDLVAAWGVPVVPTRLATTSAEARRAAEELGLPAALKLVSPDVIHKSDVDGVRLALSDGAAVADAFEQVRAVAARGQLRFGGASVQPMAPPGLELLLGAHRDEQFGPVVSFGLGGVLVEVFEDVTLRVAPLEPNDAAEMVREIRSARLLDGFRGRPALDRGAIEQTLLSLSELMLGTPDVAELDLNPVVATPTGLLAVDARVVLTSDRAPSPAG